MFEDAERELRRIGEERKLKEGYEDHPELDELKDSPQKVICGQASGVPYELEAWEEHNEASREKFVPKINSKSRKIALGKDTTQPVFERLHTLAGVMLGREDARVLCRVEIFRLLYFAARFVPRLRDEVFAGRRWQSHRHEVGIAHGPASLVHERSRIAFVEDLGGCRALGTAFFVEVSVQ